MKTDAQADALYFSGQRLIGEDFDEAQTATWYQEEEQAYQNLGYQDDSDEYPYHALNSVCGYDHLPASCRFDVVGIGSAHGREFEPLIGRMASLTIVESDKRYWKTEVSGVSCHYAAPASNGDLPLVDDSADVITCFGVLHHVAKVSAALSEMRRVLRPGGMALIREPIISMGDWRAHRPGLTKNERGIPLGLFQQMMQGAGLRIVKKKLCGYAPLQHLSCRLLRTNIWSSRTLTRADTTICSLFSNVRYHRTSALQKCSPTNVFYRATKACSPA